MRYHQTFILSFISSALATTAFANTLDTQLSGIDAAQQQRQQQHQQAQAEQLQNQPDIRLDTSSSELRLLSHTESPCYPILSIKSHYLITVLLPHKVNSSGLLITQLKH